MVYCKHCGNQLKDEAKFCGECGKPAGSIKAEVLQSEKNKVKKNQRNSSKKGELLLSLKPNFIPLLQIAPAFASFLPFGAFVALFFFAATTIPTFVYIFFGIFGAIWIGSPLFKVYFLKRTYDETEYKIYDDRVEYSEGFFNVQNNRVRLDRVIDVHFKQTFFQKWYDLGNIILDLSGGGGRNAIKFKDIKEPAKIYEKIDELIV